MRLTHHFASALALLAALLIGGLAIYFDEDGPADAPHAAAVSGTTSREVTIATLTPTATATLTPEPTSTPPPTPTATPEPEPTATPVSAAAYATTNARVAAKAVAILEAPCGALIYGKDEHLQLPPASLTKIVTALAAIDRVDLTERVDATVSASELKARNRSSVMGLEPGMNVSVEDLLYGLMLPSGNDAAIALAEHVSGSIDAFAVLMNQEAQRVGMRNSQFNNPHGLGSQGMWSTAYDMAIAGIALLQHPTLAAIVGTASYTSSADLAFRNGNRLIGGYTGADGVKIGYTRSAKHTMVGSAVRDGRHLIVSVLGSDDLYTETMALFDWAFSATERQCG